MPRTEAAQSQAVSQKLTTLTWQGKIVSKTVTAPPGSPAAGDRYIIPTGSSGAWTGLTNQIAEWSGLAWIYLTPTGGEQLYNVADSKNYNFLSGAWSAVSSTGTLLAANNLSDLASAPTARTNLGLGTAAVAASSAFDAAGAATTAQAASLQKTSNLSDLASASTARTNLGLGTAATQSVTGSVVGTTDTQTLTNKTITGLPTPSSPSDAATKSYVDATVQGLQPKPTATVATTGALAANTYANGTSGVGATLTGSATGTLTIDGHLTALNDLILVKNEGTTANNGLYIVTTAGASGVAYVLTRHVDMDQSAEFAGAFIPVGNVGTANANSLWLCNSTAVTVGTTSIVLTQLNGATDIQPGTGITISGNTVSVTGSTYSPLIGSTSITTVGNLNTGQWQATVIAPAYGGTGVANGTNTISLQGSFSITGAFTTALTVTANTAVTLPTSGTLINTVSPVLNQIKGVIFDGAGSILTNGMVASVQIPVNCVIAGWTVISLDNTSSSITIDVQTSTYAALTPGSAGTTITGSGTKPALSSATKAQSGSVTGWSPNLTAGNYLVFVTSGVSGSPKLVRIELNLSPR